MYHVFQVEIFFVIVIHVLDFPVLVRAIVDVLRYSSLRDHTGSILIEKLFRECIQFVYLEIFRSIVKRSRAGRQPRLGADGFFGKLQISIIRGMDHMGSWLVIESNFLSEIHDRFVI